MSLLTLFIFAAMAATVVSLVMGVSSMVAGHDVGHRSSDQWMFMRVGLQATALLLLLLAVLTN